MLPRASSIACIVGLDILKFGEVATKKLFRGQGFFKLGWANPIHINILGCRQWRTSPAGWEEKCTSYVQLSLGKLANSVRTVDGPRLFATCRNRQSRACNDGVKRERSVAFRGVKHTWKIACSASADMKIRTKVAGLSEASSGVAWWQSNLIVYIHSIGNAHTDSKKASVSVF